MCRRNPNDVSQGSSADITKIAMRDICRDDWLNKNDCHLVLTIHDEVVVEVPNDRIHEAGKRIRDLMINSASLIGTKMQIKCDCEVFPTSWNGDDSWKLKFE